MKTVEMDRTFSYVPPGIPQQSFLYVGGYRYDKVPEAAAEAIVAAVAGRVIEREEPKELKEDSQRGRRKSA